MQSFTASISSTWTEVLQGGANIAFDVVGSNPVRVYFTEGATPDASQDGNAVQSWPSGWDFSALGLPSGQMVWVKTLSGDNKISGVR